MSIRVETQGGVLEGQPRGGQLAFLGIPYAAPPIGARRFAAPAPPEPWSGVRAADAFGASALQGTPFAAGLDAQGPESEDCLFLNVFTRALGERKRPVLFWIHGGAYTVGSAGVPLYDGGPLVALGDVVVVTHNYRLGPFGFLDLGDAGEREDALPNAGILDHIAALTWVRANIERFGGDPADVTVFGESAGASSVAALLVAPKARGLFRRAIAQSPALYPRLPSRERSHQTYAKLCEKLALAPGDVARLRALPAAQITAAQHEIDRDGLGAEAFFPVRHRASLPLDPVDAFADPAQPRLPLIVGSNRDEWNLFDAVNIARWDQPLPRAAVIAQITRIVSGLPPERAEALIDIYARSRARLGLPNHERALLRAILGDLRFRMPALRQAELQVHAGAPVFVYMFSYESPSLRGALRACHALELAFVFGTYGTPLQERFTGGGEPVARLSETMMRSWLSFVAHDTPEVPSGFRRYDLEERPTMVFDVDSALQLDPLSEERAAWDGLL